MKLFSINMLNAEEIKQSACLECFEKHQKEQVQKALKKTFGVSQPDSINVLIGGFSQKLYKFSIKNKYYVLRLITADINQRKREIKSMMIASNVGVAPTIYYANTKDGVIIMKYIENKKLSTNDRSDPETYIKLAKLLRKVHHAPLFTKYISIFEAIAKRNNPTQLEISKLAIKKLFELEPILKKYSFKTSCHNDLNPNNILFDGKNFWMIDWEAASVGDPYFDLATISNFFIIDPKLESIYLKTYFGKNPTKKQLAHYFIMKQVALIGYGINLTKIAKDKNIASITEKDIASLPSVRDFYMEFNSKKIAFDHEQLEKNLDRLGFVMLKEAITNMDSDEFKNAVQMLSANKTFRKYN